MKFRDTIKLIRSDYSFHKERGFFQNILVFLYNPSFRLLLNYRIGCYFFNHKNSLFRKVARYYKYKQITRHNCHISFLSKLGHGTKFPHPLGIVIGDGVVIGDNVRIYQQVTLGTDGKMNDDNKDFAYPTVQDNVKIYAGAKLFGSITIGNNAVIGAAAVVNKDVPAYKVAIGIPAVIK